MRVRSTLRPYALRIGVAHRAWVSEAARDEVIKPRRPRVNPRVLKLTSNDFPRKKPKHKPSAAPQFADAFHVLR